MNRRLTAILLAVAVLAVGCSDDDTADPSTAATAATAPSTTEAPTTTAAPTTSTTEAPPTTTAPPSTASPASTPATIAADDWPAILTELSRRQVALYAAPDLSRIGEYCMPATDCARQLEAQLGDYIARGEHVEGQQPFTVVAVEKVLEGEPSPLGAITDVVFVVGPTALPAARIVDANGNVVDTLSTTTTNTRGRFLLAKWDDAALPWRLVMAESLGPA
jgi:hypothetical protein